MNLEGLLQQVLNVAGTFNLQLVIFLFLICCIGEFGLSIPYLLETVWLLSGYHLGSGVISPFDLSLLWLAAQAGRQSGAIMLFYFSRLGSAPLRRLYHRYFGAILSEKLSGNNAVPLRLLHRVSELTPFSVAMGRMFGLRIPLTLTLAVQKRLRTLLPGVLLQSLVWDAIYISLGIIGGHAELSPIEMLAYSLIGLTALYVVTLMARQLARHLSRFKRISP